MSENPEVILGAKKSVTIEDIYRELSNDFIKHEEVVKLLYNGYHSGNNVILYGPPGYGKSEMSEAFLKALGYTDDEIGVFSVNMDTAPEELFGNINMEKLHSDNKFEMNIHKSIFSKEVVILEELFDGTPAALASLKHVLTKKVYYYNDQRYEIKTKFIIGCTNKNTSEFNEDNQDTYRALIERFPIIKQLKWDSHLQKDYVQLLRKKFSGKISREELDGLGMIFQRSRFENGHISPRIAITATKSFLVGKDVHDLGFVLPELDSAVISESVHLFKKIDRKDLTHELEMKTMEKLMQVIDPVIDAANKNLEDVFKISDKYERIAGLDAMHSYLQDLKDDFSASVTLSNERLQEIMTAKLYDRINSLMNKIEVAKTEIFADINNKKKDTLFVIYSKLSLERHEKLMEINELIKDL